MVMMISDHYGYLNTFLELPPFHLKESVVHVFLKEFALNLFLPCVVMNQFVARDHSNPMLYYSTLFVYNCLNKAN